MKEYICKKELYELISGVRVNYTEIGNKYTLKNNHFQQSFGRIVGYYEYGKMYVVSEGDNFICLLHEDSICKFFISISEIRNNKIDELI